MQPVALNADQTMFEYSPTVRIERRGRPEADGSYVWVAYKLTPVSDGIHPVTNQPTDVEAVWMIAGSGTQAEADAIAQSLVAAQ